MHLTLPCNFPTPSPSFHQHCVGGYQHDNKDPINAKGLNHPVKRSLLWKLATDSQCNILYVQETHFYATNPPSWMHKNFSCIYTANASAKKKGVLIAFKHTINLQLKDCIKDAEEWYLIPLCSINDSYYTFVTVYAPNTHQLRFLQKLHKKVSAVQHGSVLWCGTSTIFQTRN